MTLTNVLLVLLCMYIANPFFIASIEQVNKFVYYVFGLMALPMLLGKGNELRFKRKNICFVAYVILYYVLVIVIAQQGDGTYVVYLTRQLQRLLGMISVVLIWGKLYESGKTSLSFPKIYLYSIFTYMCSTFFFIFNPEAKRFWINTIVQYQEDYLLQWSRFSTRFGFAGWSGFDISIYVIIGFVFLYYMYLNKEVRFKYLLFASLILIIGATIYARSGSMLSMIMVMVMVLNELRKKKTKFLRYGIVGVLLLIAGVFAIQKHIPAAQEAVDWMLEFVNGKGRSGSTDELLSMYQNFSPSIKTLLIGDGRWNNSDGSYYGHVDVGILRNILYGGIFYTFIEYGLAIYFINLVSNRCKKCKIIDYKIIMTLMSLIFIFCELKGDMIFYNLRMMIPFLWILCPSGKYIQKVKGYR